jgi:succinate-semialdehyde dehydrogenase/glutarate-semialdehyde dehydrogenase
LIGDARIAALTLTGSTRAGRAVAEAAGAALKKVVLELGGSDPYVVLADADLEHAAATCVRARLVNGGQSCIAAKRFIVSDPLHDAFAARVTELMSAARLGDPLSEQTEIGPQARVDLRDDLHRQVCQSVARGARLRCGGSIPSEAGAWYPATVLTEVAPGMPAYHDELFGPVAAVIRARDTTDAIRIANDTAYGLGAAVFTTDLARGREIAQRELQAGYCAVNTQVRSDPRVPFGGIKASGYGARAIPLRHSGIRQHQDSRNRPSAVSQTQAEAWRGAPHRLVGRPVRIYSHEPDAAASSPLASRTVV